MEKKTNVKQTISKFEIDLIKLAKMNFENLKKINDNLIKFISHEDAIKNAYYRLSKNKRSLMQSTDPKNTIDGFNKDLIESISENVKKGTYKWKDIFRVVIPKLGKAKKRSLDIPNFSDKIVQENIRLMLNIIYEPIFQSIQLKGEEVSHGFRPKRNISTAMRNLSAFRTQGLNIALEGDIKEVYDHVNHKKLMLILKEKINDKKFLKLIKTGLKQCIHFKELATENKVGVPQGGIVSPVLFNIYMHKFDKFVLRIVEEFEERNAKEQRKVNANFQLHRDLTNQKKYKRTQLRRMFEKKQLLNNKGNYLNLIEEIRRKDKLQRKCNAGDRNKALYRTIYCRYANDWILISNLDEKTIKELKKKITHWLKENLKLKLDQDKTKITNLKTGQAKFLGFTLFKKRHKKITRNTTRVQDYTGIGFGATKKIFKQRTNESLFIGIDHDRIKQRLKDQKIMSQKYRARSVGLYLSLKTWQIVEKFKQKIEGIVNYFYEHLTYKSDLAFYYYIIKYSCVHTLAHKKKSRVPQVFKQYGPQVTVKGELIGLNNRGEPTTKTIQRHIPKYQKMLLNAKKITENQRKKREIKSSKELFELFEMDGRYFTDPLSLINVRANVRTCTKVYEYCSICGVNDSKENKIEMRYIKHTKKSNIKNFAEAMKSSSSKDNAMLSKLSSKDTQRRV